MTIYIWLNLNGNGFVHTFFYFALSLNEFQCYETLMGICAVAHTTHIQRDCERKKKIAHIDREEAHMR